MKRFLIIPLLIYSVCIQTIDPNLMYGLGAVKNVPLEYNPVLGLPFLKFGIIESWVISSQEDALMQLTHRLFTMSDGSLQPVMISYLTPEHIGTILYGIRTYGGNSADLQKYLISYFKNILGVDDSLGLSKNVTTLIRLIMASLEYVDLTTVYPRYSVQSLLLGYLCAISESKEDIQAYFKGFLQTPDFLLPTESSSRISGSEGTRKIVSNYFCSISDSLEFKKFVQSFADRNKPYDALQKFVLLFFNFTDDNLVPNRSLNSLINYLNISDLGTMMRMINQYDNPEVLTQKLQNYLVGLKIKNRSTGDFLDAASFSPLLSDVSQAILLTKSKDAKYSPSFIANIFQGCICSRMHSSQDVKNYCKGFFIHVTDSLVNQMQEKFACCLHQSSVRDDSDNKGDEPSQESDDAHKFEHVHKELSESEKSEFLDTIVERTVEHEIQQEQVKNPIAAIVDELVRAEKWREAEKKDASSSNIAGQYQYNSSTPAGQPLLMPGGVYSMKKIKERQAALEQQYHQLKKTSGMLQTALSKSKSGNLIPVLSTQQSTPGTTGDDQQSSAQSLSGFPRASSLSRSTVTQQDDTSSNEDIGQYLQPQIVSNVGNQDQPQDTTTNLARAVSNMPNKPSSQQETSKSESERSDTERAAPEPTTQPTQQQSQVSQTQASQIARSLVEQPSIPNQLLTTSVSQSPKLIDFYKQSTTKIEPIPQVTKFSQPSTPLLSQQVEIPKPTMPSSFTEQGKLAESAAQQNQVSTGVQLTQFQSSELISFYQNNKPAIEPTLGNLVLGLQAMLGLRVVPKNKVHLMGNLKFAVSYLDIICNKMGWKFNASKFDPYKPFSVKIGESIFIIDLNRIKLIPVPQTENKNRRSKNVMLVSTATMELVNAKTERVESLESTKTEQKISVVPSEFPEITNLLSRSSRRLSPIKLSEGLSFIANSMNLFNYSNDKSFPFAGQPWFNDWSQAQGTLNLTDSLSRSYLPADQTLPVVVPKEVISADDLSLQQVKGVRDNIPSSSIFGDRATLRITDDGLDRTINEWRFIGTKKIAQDRSMVNSDEGLSSKQESKSLPTTSSSGNTAYSELKKLSSQIALGNDVAGSHDEPLSSWASIANERKSNSTDPEVQGKNDVGALSSDITSEQSSSGNTVIQREAEVVKVEAGLGDMFQNPGLTDQDIEDFFEGTDEISDSDIQEYFKKAPAENILKTFEQIRKKLHDNKKADQVTQFIFDKYTEALFKRAQNPLFLFEILKKVNSTTRNEMLRKILKSIPLSRLAEFIKALGLPDSDTGSILSEISETSKKQQSSNQLSDTLYDKINELFEQSRSSKAYEEPWPEQRTYRTQEQSRQHFWGTKTSLSTTKKSNVTGVENFYDPYSSLRGKSQLELVMSKLDEIMRNKSVDTVSDLRKFFEYPNIEYRKGITFEDINKYFKFAPVENISEVLKVFSQATSSQRNDFIESLTGSSLSDLFKRLPTETLVEFLKGVNGDYKKAILNKIPQESLKNFIDALNLQEFQQVIQGISREDLKNIKISDTQSLYDIDFEKFISSAKAQQLSQYGQYLNTSELQHMDIEKLQQLARERQAHYQEWYSQQSRLFAQDEPAAAAASAQAKVPHVSHPFISVAGASRYVRPLSVKHYVAENAGRFIESAGRAALHGLT